MTKTSLGIAFGSLLAASVAFGGGEIHGTVQTTDGRTLTGPIRWDDNEGFWDDCVDAYRVETGEQREGGFKLSFFGWKIVDPADSVRSVSSVSIPFGHLRAIEPVDAKRALLALKSGEELQAMGYGGDLGRHMDGIRIEDPEKGSVEVTWSRLKRVEFAPGPGEGRDDQRLHGTVRTSAGELSGFIVWDADETLGSDILDGEDADTKQDREIPFGEIREIRRLPEGGSRVVLSDGKELTLHGTNDVDRGHRGISIVLPRVGTAEVEWDDVESVRFSEPPPSPRYEAFDGGRRLHGKVRTAAGHEYSGHIVWDMDETRTWESLDGDRDGVEYSIRFEGIRSITPAGPTACEVALVDDSSLVLSGSNDVNDSNRGVQIVWKDGNRTVEVTLSLDEIETVEFD